MLTKTDLQEINKLIKPVKQDVKEIRKDVKALINYFDREYLELRARVEKIEEHLNISVS